MRLTGRSVTVLLSTLLIVILTAGATAAWALGRQRVDSSITSSSAPSTTPPVPAPIDPSGCQSGAGQHPRAQEIRDVVAGLL